jgi:cell division inhibitor SepF
MVEDNKDVPQDKPAITTGGRATKKQEVDLFPALTDKRAVPMTTSLRQNNTSRIGTQISIFSPVSFEEALEIVECLRGRAATTISLENMKKIDANRLVDFVAGASAALDGDFHKLSEQVYIFCPSNIKITAPGKQIAASVQPTSLDATSLDFLYPKPGAEGNILSNPSWS